MITDIFKIVGGLIALTGIISFTLGFIKNKTDTRLIGLKLTMTGYIILAIPKIINLF